MSASNIFGQIVSPQDVEDAVVATLNLWIGDCLGEMERLAGYAPNSIQRPKGIVNSSEWEKWPEDQIPVILVVNAGLAGKSHRRANGVHDVSWLLGISPVVSDVDPASTRKLALTYVTAVKLALLQHKMLKSARWPNGFASWMDWHDESYGDVPFLSTRSLDAGRVTIEVGVEGVLTEQAGPKVPSTDPTIDPGPWPTVSQPPATTVIPRSPLEAVTS